MADDSLTALHERIAELETALAEARRRKKAAPKDLTAHHNRSKKLQKQATELERAVTRRRRAVFVPLRVRNGAALGIALVGLLSFGVGFTLQARIARAPLVWVESTCRVIEGDPTFAYSDLRPNSSFHVSVAASGTPVPCWIPDDPVGDGLGTLARPASTKLSLAEKLRSLFGAMMLLGLGSAGGVAWLSIIEPAKESSD